MMFEVLPWTRFVIDRLFILSSAALHHSPAYLFATDSASVRLDSEDSWTDYILLYLNNRFTAYALPLTGALIPAFAFGLRLQTAFPLISSLIIHSLHSRFAMDD